ncbi:pantothenate kinase [Brasilonema sp. UFV-L1]|uniref:pantothenate kinase n=1 Tax=Brasilonema sp. UFV-L1 TaxID=2234130 RepID=UPI00145C75C2|nr:pantothenate kinase [Brasilonema sp. UFV-L1]NMG05639.1 pantothenate kinase [Brasilonema sp. UFV-L1]
MRNSSFWLALMIGNSRLHWAHFIGETLIRTWDTNYMPANIVQKLSQSKTLNDLPPEILPPNEGINGQGDTGDHRSEETMEGRTEGEFSLTLSLSDSLNPLSPHLPIPLLLASVVPNQTALWQTYPNVCIITLEQVPIKGIYSTLGIDRALALLGAGQVWGFPVLVIDAGTALTFTGADTNHCLVGGAILPGLGLQLATLAERTGQLPTVESPQQLPQRYALNTQQAMQSGVIYTLVAGIKDFIEAWWRDFPQGKIVMTGGDRTLLVKYLQSQETEIAAHVIVETNLIFWGMQKCNERCCFHPRCDRLKKKDYLLGEIEKTEG